MIRKQKERGRRKKKRNRGAELEFRARLVGSSTIARLMRRGPVAVIRTVGNPLSQSRTTPRPSPGKIFGDIREFAMHLPRYHGSLPVQFAARWRRLCHELCSTRARYTSGLSFKWTTRPGSRRNERLRYFPPRLCPSKSICQTRNSLPTRGILEFVSESVEKGRNIVENWAKVVQFIISLL